MSMQISVVTGTIDHSVMDQLLQEAMAMTGVNCAYKSCAVMSIYVLSVHKRAWLLKLQMWITSFQSMQAVMMS